MITSDTIILEPTDQQLWSVIRYGNEQAYTRLFDRYHRTLYNYGSKLSGNSAIVEDAVQEVFIDVWRLRANLTENVTSVKFYLYRALRRRIHVATDKFPVTEELTMLPDQEIPSTYSNSETILIQSESNSMISRKVKEMLTQLPERQLEVITLRYFDDFSVEEIAGIMGINEKSVRNLIYKAITSFRQSPQNFLISVLIFCLLVVL